MRWMSKTFFRKNLIDGKSVETWIAYFVWEVWGSDEVCEDSQQKKIQFLQWESISFSTYL